MDGLESGDVGRREGRGLESGDAGWREEQRGQSEDGGKGEECKVEMQDGGFKDGGRNGECTLPPSSTLIMATCLNSLPYQPSQAAKHIPSISLLK